MPLCRINVIDGEIAAPQTTAAALERALSRLHPGAPVVVLIHGFKFSPSVARTDPHTHILSLSPSSGCWKALPWPRELGLGSGQIDEPLCIALGWEARGSLWQAYGRAEQTGRALSELTRLIRQRRPGQRIDVLAHSLGCRVALAALPHLPSHAMGRAILMAPADLRSVAADRLATPAGRSAEFINITSRENGLYDRALKWLVAPHRPGDRALGAGLSQMSANWTDVNIDCPHTRATLTEIGYPVAASDKRVCHWSVYLRPGLFPFYRAVFNRSVPLAALRTHGTQTRQDHGWRRLAHGLTRALPTGSRQAS